MNGRQGARLLGSSINKMVKGHTSLLLTEQDGNPIRTTAGVRLVAEVDELAVAFCAAAPKAATRAIGPSHMREGDIFQG